MNFLNSRVQPQNKKTLYVLRGTFFAVTGIFLFVLMFYGSQLIVSKFFLPQSTGEQAQQASAAKTVLAPVESVDEASQATDVLGLESGSWDGEIVSNVDVPIYPTGEGVIINWNVSIGKSVYKGQVLGQLSPPANSIDQSLTLAERKGALESAKTKSGTAANYTTEARKRLEERRDSAGKLKAAAHKAADKEGDETLRNKAKADADSEYVKTATEIDIENAKLTQEQANANADIRGAEIASSAIGLDRNIYALKAGIVSGINKNVGDYVTPDTLIASIGIQNPTQNDRYIRFNIPNYYMLPIVGEEVKIKRPGYPYVTYNAKITGVGTAIDQTGSYTAEAAFNDILNLSVHTKVRVVATNQKTQGIFIPVSALWFDDAGKSNVWQVNAQNVVSPLVVETGRAIGDKVEIINGLSRTQKYVSQVNADIKTGVKVSQTKQAGSGEEVKEVSGDGHGHAHDE